MPKGGSLDDSIYGSFNVINNYNGDKGTYRLERFKTDDGENYFQLIYRDKSDREDTILSQFYNENEAIKYFNKYKKRLEGHYKISDTIYVNNADYEKGGKLPSQEEVDKSFSEWEMETHYLNNKPVKGQKPSSNKVEIDEWDKYDLSNWNALVRSNRKIKKFSKGGEIKKQDKTLIGGLIGGVLLGIFLNR